MRIPNIAKQGASNISSGHEMRWWKPFCGISARTVQIDNLALAFLCVTLRSICTSSYYAMVLLPNVGFEIVLVLASVLNKLDTSSTTILSTRNSDAVSAIQSLRPNSLLVVEAYQPMVENQSV